MKRALLAYLVCPACQAELVANLPAPETDGEYMSGELSCTRCQRVYRIVDGIPRMVVTDQEPDGAATTFGFEWSRHGEKQLEGETVFGRTQAQDVAYFLAALRVTPEQMRDAIVLDAGCGSGQLTEAIGQMQAKAVIGVDVNTAIGFPYRRCRHLPNVHIVNADLQALPFRPTQFDVVWSNGVIHHSADPRRVFDALSGAVRPGGRLYVWVYERRWNPFRFTKDALDSIGLRRVPLNVLLWFCKIIAPVSFMVHSVYRAIRLLPFLRPVSFAGKNTTRYRSVRELELTWFDALSPKYDFRFTESEISEWFRAQGFRDLAPYQHRVGVCGVKQ